jgi:hypothetical protein
MSVSAKKNAKALRARYGMAKGIRQAKQGQKCRAGKMDENHNVQAHVVEPFNHLGRVVDVPLCYEHMKIAHKPRRR